METINVNQPPLRAPWRARLYLLAKKSHRLLVVVMIFITLIMAGTGTFLKYPRWAILLRLDLGWMRYLHNQLSPIFTVILTIMALSGLIMYWYPWHTRRRAKLDK